MKHIQVDDIIYNELKFDSSNSLANNPLKYPLSIFTVRLRGSEKYIRTLSSGLTFLWDSGDAYSMTNRKNINPYRSKIRYNNIKYIMADGQYRTTHDVQVPFIIPYFSRRKIITHIFQVDIARGDKGINYDMIIGRDIMVQKVLKADFPRQVLEWDETIVPMTELLNFLGQPELNKSEMIEVVM